MYACGWDRVYAYAMLYMSHTCSVRVRNSLYDIGILCMMVCVSGFRVAVPVLAFLWGRCGDHPYLTKLVLLPSVAPIVPYVKISQSMATVCMLP